MPSPKRNIKAAPILAFMDAYLAKLQIFTGRTFLWGGARCGFVPTYRQKAFISALFVGTLDAKSIHQGLEGGSLEPQDLGEVEPHGREPVAPAVRRNPPKLQSSFPSSVAGPLRRTGANHRR